MRPQLNPLILGPGAPWSLPGSSLDLQFTTGRAAVNRQKSSISSLLTTTRASTGYASTSTGFLTLFPTNTPRITDLGLLVEQAATNLALNSNDLTQATSWTLTNTTASSNQVTGPDGATSGGSLADNSTNGNHNAFASFTAVSGTTYTSSIYLKAGTATVAQLTFASGQFSGTGYANFNLSTGTVSSTGGTLVASGIVAAANGFYRCWIAATATASAVSNATFSLTNNNTSATRNASYAGSGQALNPFGAQIEASAFPTSYIPTTTVAVTRAADFITVNNSTNYLGSASWSALANVSTPQAALGGNSAPFSMDDGTTTNMFYPFLLNGFLLLRIGARGAGSSGSGAFGSNPTANVPFKTGQIARPGATSFIVSGGTGTTLVAAPSATLNRIVLGSDAFLETWNGTISRFTVWKSDIGNTVMTALSQ